MNRKLRVLGLSLIPFLFYLSLFMLDWILKFKITQILADTFEYFPEAISNYPIVFISLVVTIGLCIIRLFRIKNSHLKEKITFLLTPILGLISGIAISLAFILMIGIISIIFKNEFM